MAAPPGGHSPGLPRPATRSVDLVAAGPTDVHTLGRHGFNQPQSNLTFAQVSAFLRDFVKVSSPGEAAPGAARCALAVQRVHHCCRSGPYDCAQQDTCQYFLFFDLSSG